MRLYSETIYLRFCATLAAAAILVGGCSDEKTPVGLPLDFLPPRIEWITPQSGAELKGMEEISFTVHDDENRIDRITVYRNGISPDEWGISVSEDTIYTISWDTREVEDDVYILEVRAWDGSGNMGASTSLLLRVRNNQDDNTPPDVWWTAPEAGSTLQDTVRLRLRFFDEVGVDSIRLIKNGAPVVTLLPPGFRLFGNMKKSQIPHSRESGNPEITSPYWIPIPAQPGFEGGSEGDVSNDSLTYLWDTRSDSDGVHIWEARAWDDSGNMGISLSLLLRVKNNPEPPEEDVTPPVIIWMSPEPGDTLAGTTQLRFQVMDVSPLDSVQVYLSGQKWQNFHDVGNYYDGIVIWQTNDWNDGNYIIQVKAFDAYGNVGLSEVVWFSVWNDRPRVIWVPDDFETIQGAINASEDGDTVRVRAGTYHEGLRLMGKNIWLESEEGPEVTIIDSRGLGTTIFYRDGEDIRSAIRGFRILSSWNGISPSSSSINIYNCIITSENAGIWIGGGNSRVYNCIFDNCAAGVLYGYSWGLIRNSIFINCEIGIGENAVDSTYLDYGWDLFWPENDSNYFGSIGPNQNDLFSDPLFLENSYQLSNNSPAINSGDPNILDLDGTRSDIGVYGGRYAYPIR